MAPVAAATLPPLVLLGARDEPAGRITTDRHRALLRDPGLREPATWSAAALAACLEHLLVSTVTQAARVAVIEAWTDGPDAFCVLYRPPLGDGRVVGLRRSRGEAVETREWRLGDMTTWGYAMDGALNAPDGVDPVAFGWNVADFDLGEPLGFVATILRYDRADVGWWGSLGAELPEPPAL